jgi:hypothetical protein
MQGNIESQNNFTSTRSCSLCQRHKGKSVRKNNIFRSGAEKILQPYAKSKYISTQTLNYLLKLTHNGLLSYSKI